MPNQRCGFEPRRLHAGTRTKLESKFSMVFINEWLPNPNGVDTKAEFIELFNNGDVSVSLGGWTIKTTGKKAFSLGGRTIAARGYLVLNRTETKLSLKNNGESVFLYDAAGRLVDQSSYIGAAPSGKSFSRIPYSGAGDALGAGAAAAQPQAFAWSTPSPGAMNKISLNNNINTNNYPFGMPLNGGVTMGGMSGFGIFLMALVGVSAILAVTVVYCLKSHEDLANLFFPRDGAIGH